MTINLKKFTPTSTTNHYTCSEEVYGKLWIIRNAKGVEVARSGNLAYALFILDALNGKDE